MIEKIDLTPVDRTNWGPGSWDGEPDRAEWYHMDIPCLVTRSHAYGFWCGYAAVGPEHPLYKMEDLLAVPVDVHGGVTYAAVCDGHRVCHVARPGDPDDVWWFGFDCGHALDVAPAMEARIKDLDALRPDDDPINRLVAAMLDNRHYQPTYRTLAYVQAETMDLARQLKEFNDASRS